MKNFLVYNGKKDGYNFEISADKNSISGVPPEKKISRLIDENIDYVSGVFYLPDNGDIVLRKFAVDLGEKKVRAFLLSVDGLSDGDSINQFILEPLMNLKMRNADSSDLLNTLEHTLLPQGQITVTDNLKDMALKVNIGNAALVIDGLEKGFIVDVKSWEHRSVDNPENEAVIQGPHEGFNEVLRSNTALIRKTLNTPNLVMENVFLGSTSKTPGALAYVRNVANESLVAEVKKRVENIGAEYILSTLDVEQYIEEATFMPIPQMITTERPDRVCRALTEGRVAVVMNGSSHVLVMPATFFDLITSAEDEYLRYPYSMLIRILRYIAVFVALLFPALFLSVLNFHPSLLPTNLMLAISSSRALVPFGSVVELLIMELAFELIKEAGIRVPGPIGSTRHRGRTDCGSSGGGRKHRKPDYDYNCGGHGNCGVYHTVVFALFCVQVFTVFVYIRCGGCRISRRCGGVLYNHACRRGNEVVRRAVSLTAHAVLFRQVHLADFRRTHMEKGHKA